MSTEETAPPPAAEAAETPAPEASPAEPASSETTSAAVDAAADALEKVGVAEPADPDAPDAPDLALKSEVLVEQEETVVEKKVVDDTPYASAKSFEELGLSAELLQGLYSEMKFERPSKIQGETLPMILTPPHRNLIAQAHNGSGKTTCFTLGMLSRVDPSLQAPQALCICPTRELAIQNMQVMEKMGKYAKISIAYTADPRWADRVSKRDKVVDQVVIGTPGKVLGWMREKQLNCATMKILVFDEADQMMDTDGHRVDSLKIMKHLKSSTKVMPQVLLFSATFNERVKDFSTKVVPNANQIFLPAHELSLDVIKQYRVNVESTEAKEILLKEKIFPCCDKIGQTIIFVRTREGCKRLMRAMNEAGYKCTAIEGGMDHADRDRVVKEFRDGLTKILISTDVLSRGLDVSTVTLVINYDMPVEHSNPRAPNFETYLHRIGRSGRFGKKGAAFNLLLGADERAVLDSIADHFDHPVPEVKFEDDDAFETVLEEAGLMSKEEEV
jgi:ATP-dependent RNA helicase DDX19/DBP5